MNIELEQEILKDIEKKDLNQFAIYLGLDTEDLEDLYFEFDDYSR